MQRCLGVASLTRLRASMALDFAWKGGDRPSVCELMVWLPNVTANKWGCDRSFASNGMKGFSPPTAGSKAAIWGSRYIRPSVVSSNVLAEPYKGERVPLPLWSIVTPYGWKQRWSRWKDSFKSMYSLSKLKKNVKHWNLRDFKLEALGLYKETCRALAQGDVSSLRKLTTPPIFSDMKRQMKQRQDGGWHHVEWKIVEEPSLVNVEMLHARLVTINPKDDASGFVQLTVKIPSKQMFVAYDKQGKIVAGDVSRMTAVTDHWVFEIPLSNSAQQKWRVAGRLDVK